MTDFDAIVTKNGFVQVAMLCVEQKSLGKRAKKRISDKLLSDFHAIATKNVFEQVEMLCVEHEFPGKRAENTFTISY